MIPANKIKEISNNIHNSYGDSDGIVNSWIAIFSSMLFFKLFAYTLL